MVALIIPAVATPLIARPDAFIVTPNPNVGVPVVFKLPSKVPLNVVAVAPPVILAPSGKLGVAPPLPDKLVTLMVDIYRSPICRTSITRVLPTPTVIPTPDFTVIVGMVLTTIEL